MNIEDERKEFEAALSNGKLYQNRLALWNGERYVFKLDSVTHKPLIQVMFEVWIAAKTPWAKIQYHPQDVWWVVTKGMRQGTFATKQEALEKALSLGLRIVEPETEFLDIY